MIYQPEHVNTEMKKLQEVTPKSDKEKRGQQWGQQEEVEIDGKSTIKKPYSLKS